MSTLVLLSPSTLPQLGSSGFLQIPSNTQFWGLINLKGEAATAPFKSNPTVCPRRLTERSCEDTWGVTVGRSFWSLVTVLGIP